MMRLFIMLRYRCRFADEIHTNDQIRSCLPAQVQIARDAIRLVDSIERLRETFHWLSIRRSCSSLLATNSEKSTLLNGL